jgi:putative Holliday junction resolvase
VGRILALDFGKQRIGVAISDSLKITAQPFTTWTGLSISDVIKHLIEIISQWDVEKIIVGYPLTLRGRAGKMALHTEKVVNRLKLKLSIPVILWDERLTTVMAKQILNQMAIRPSKNKEKVDLVASMIILQEYLDRTRGSTKTHTKEAD